jgi:hypothetical protein
MNNSPHNPTQVNDAGEMEPELQAEGLTELARAYFAHDFPNPARHDCPERATLRASAQTGRLPDDALRAHLFGCSECFQDYRAARQVPAPVTSSWSDLLRARFTLKPALAWTGAALLLLTAGLFSWTNRRSEAQPGAALTQAQTPTPTLPVMPSVAPSQVPAPRRSAAATTVQVDLNAYLALRDVTEPSGARPQAIALSPVRTRLHLRLPEGSLPGGYTVSLLDEFDRAIATERATSRDGQRLSVLLDLRGADARSYRLRLQFPGEPPALYPVRVTAGSN